MLVATQVPRGNQFDIHTPLACSRHWPPTITPCFTAFHQPEARENGDSRHLACLLCLDLLSDWPLRYGLIEPPTIEASREEMGQILVVVLPPSMLGSLLAGWLNTRIGRLA